MVSRNIIPSLIIRRLKLKEGSALEVIAEGNRIVLEPVKCNKAKFFTEDELLSGNIYTAEDELLPANLDSEWVD